LLVFALVLGLLGYAVYSGIPFGPPLPFDASRDAQIFWAEGKLTRFLQSQAVGDSIWSGGLSGPEGSALALPILCIAAVIIAATFKCHGHVISRC